MKKLRENITIPYLLLLLFSLAPLFSASAGVASFRDVIVVFILLFIYTVFKKTYLNKQSNFASKLIILLWVIALFTTLLSSIVSINRTIITFSFFAMIAIMFSKIKYSKGDIVFFEKTYILIALFFVICIILSWLTQNPYEYYRYSIDVLGIHKNPNYINSYLLLSVVFIFHLTNNRKTLLFAIAAISAIAFAIILTGTRAALLTLVILLLFYLLYFLVKKKKIYIIILSIAIGALLFYFARKYIPSVAWDRMFGDTFFQDSVRTPIWEQALGLFKKYPFGAGLNSVEKYLLLQGEYQYLHNVILQLLCELGIIGFIIFFLIYIYSFANAEKPNRIWIVMISISVLIPLFFQNGLIGLPFWWPISFLLIFSNVRTKKEPCINQ